jgi:hypothetical protein
LDRKNTPFWGAYLENTVIKKGEKRGLAVAMAQKRDDITIFFHHSYGFYYIPYSQNPCYMPLQANRHFTI